MKKLLALIFALAWLPLLGDDLPSLFNRALSAEDKEYSKLREQILASEPSALKGFLEEKVKSTESTVLEVCLAHIIKEHIDKKAAIDNLLYFGREKEESSNGLVCAAWELSVFRFPYEWTTAPNDKLNEIMAEYRKDECPYFILESLWKYVTASNIRFRDSQGVRGFNLPVLIFFGIGKSLPPDLKEGVIAAIKDRISRNLKSASEVESFEYLQYMDVEDACQLLLDFGKAQIAGSHQGWGGGEVYRPLCYLLPSMKGVGIKDLKAAVEILDTDKGEYSVKKYAGSKKLLNELIQFYEKGTAPDDKWVSSYLSNAEAMRISLILLKPFLLKLRPNYEGKFQSRKNSAKGGGTFDPFGFGAGGASE